MNGGRPVNQAFHLQSFCGNSLVRLEHRYTVVKRRVTSEFGYSPEKGQNKSKTIRYKSALHVSLKHFFIFIFVVVA